MLVRGKIELCIKRVYTNTSISSGVFVKKIWHNLLLFDLVAKSISKMAALPRKPH